MKFLDGNGVTTLWNKIKSEFISNPEIQGGGGERCIKLTSGDYSIRIGRIYLTNDFPINRTNEISDTPTDYSVYGIAIVHETDKTEFTLFTATEINSSYGPDCAYIGAGQTVYANGMEITSNSIVRFDDKWMISEDQNADNEYAVNITDDELTKILV